MGKPRRGDDRRRRRLIWPLVLLPLAGVIVFVGLPVAWWVTTGTTALNDALSDLRAAGIPTTLREIIPPPVPEAGNAALVYEKAWTELGKLPKDVCDAASGLAKMPPAKWPASDRKALSEFLRSKADAVGLTKRAARLSKCRFPLDYSAGLDVRLSHLPEMRELTRLLRLDSLDHLARNDFEGAVSSALTGMQIARHCETDASMLSKLSGLACHAISAETFQTVLKLGDPTTAQLRALLPLLEREAPDTDMKAPLGAEIGLMCDVYDRLRTGGPVAGVRSGAGQDPPPWWLQLVHGRDEAFYCRVMLRYSKLADKPYCEVKAEADAINDEVEKAGWPCSLARTITPRCGAAFAAASRAEAQHQVLRLAVALMIYDKRHGRFPARLGDLVPEIIPKVPTDPFSGKPYVYRREREGFVVYSLDQDMRDDGGVPRPPKAKKGDTVFRYTRTE